MTRELGPLKVHAPSVIGHMRDVIVDLTTDAIIDEGMLANCVRQGERFWAFPRSLPDGEDVLGDVCGLGLMNVIDFVEPGPEKAPNAAVQKRFLAGLHRRGMLVIGVGTYENMVRFLPPITISDEDMGTAMQIISAVARETLA